MLKAMELSDDEKSQLMESSRKIPNAHLQGVCRPRSGEDTCRYMMMVKNENDTMSHACAKKTSLKERLDHCVIKNVIMAKGDNCEGLGRLIEVKTDG